MNIKSLARNVFNLDTNLIIRLRKVTYRILSLVARVAAESFEIDSTRPMVLPLNGLKIPELRAAMLAIGILLPREHTRG